MGGYPQIGIWRYQEVDKPQVVQFVHCQTGRDGVTWLNDCLSKTGELLLVKEYEAIRACILVAMVNDTLIIYQLLADRCVELGDILDELLRIYVPEELHVVGEPKEYYEFYGLSFAEGYGLLNLQYGELRLKVNVNIPDNQLLELYEANGWITYTLNPETLFRAVLHSHVVSVWDADRLVGLIRVLSDKQVVVFIQDILVHPAYQRRGIGTRLLEFILRRYSHIRQVVLLTDNAQQTVSFYQKVGLSRIEELSDLTAFVKMG